MLDTLANVLMPDCIGGLLIMKNNIHPKYYRAKVICLTCGNTFETGSTESEIKVDTCSKCHSFYTGKINITADTGRVAKFRKKLESAK